MAGVTDLPFRQLAWELGAGLVVGEMTSADPKLWDTEISQRRRLHGHDCGPRAVQIAGGDPEQVAAAAVREAAGGADIIDINMGCPAKKVCSKAAGSSLLKDEGLVARILEGAVRAVTVPVTVKIRTGWSPELRNGVRIARIAEQAGVVSIAVHGRTRACRFVGAVEYDTIAAIKAAVRIPVFANGDIADVASARAVLAHTGADGLLIGRAALGAPWLPGDIARALAGGVGQVVRAPQEIVQIACRHISAMHTFYGNARAVGIVRKHVKRYFEHLRLGDEIGAAFNRLEVAAAQTAFLTALGRTLEHARAA
jgi:tRNA-dihydrouridine synthase B